MKKSLVLAMALTLGVAGTAFAANPFSDVPSDHWSYASVAKLAQAGVIQGYGDDTFRGDRNLTRYEMAEMVAKAMTKQDQLNAANKAMLEKLAAEYAAELKNLGVRVSNLEKYSDKVQINGEMRARYQDFSKDNSSNRAQLRTRLWLTGEVNDNWKAIAMLENVSDLAHNPGDAAPATDSGIANNGVNGTVKMERAYVEGRFGKAKVTAGRFSHTLAKAMVMDDLMNGVRVDYGDNKFGVGIFYGRTYAAGGSIFSYASAAEGFNRDAYGIEGKYNFKKLDIFGQYTRQDLKYRHDGINERADSNIAELGLAYKFDKNFNMFAEYIHGSKVNELADKTNGWAARLNYGTFNKNKKGSYNIYAQYFDVPAGADISGHSDFGFVTQKGGAGFGTKGWELGVDYAAQKNLRLHVSYGQGKTNANHDASKKDQIYTYATFYF